MIAEARYLGTHIGPFHGLAPTGRDIDLRLAVIITFRDGLMLGERFYYDLSSLLFQLGVTSLPAISKTNVV
jgi:predicted ester cyclase